MKPALALALSVLAVIWMVARPAGLPVLALVAVATIGGMLRREGL